MLKIVTLTGADDSVEPGQMLELSREFPFVEWGILVSAKNQNSSRYPSLDWMCRLATLNTHDEMQLSMHLQGRLLRELWQVIEPEIIYRGNWHWFPRLQMNFHAERVELSPEELRTFSDNLWCHNHVPRGGKKQYLFQMDGVNEDIWQWLFGECERAIDVVPFFDTSHGAGLVPLRWPVATYLTATPGPSGAGIEIPLIHGYAGGLGPDNLEQQLPLIAQAAGRHPYWIDMETKIRSGEKFDIAKCRSVLEYCAPFVGQ